MWFSALVMMASFLTELGLIPWFSETLGGLFGEMGWVTGFLAPVGDVTKMAEYAIQILSDCTTCRAFSRAACERAATNFDYRDLIPKYEAVYDQVLG